MVFNRKLVLSVLLALVLALPLITYALKEDYKVLEPQSSLPAGKEFVIQFDRPLQESTINNTNIYVENSKGFKTPTSASLSSDKKSIIIKPLKHYSNDESYTLYIRGNVKYTTGRQLKEGLKLSFDIAPYKEGLPVVGSRQKLLELLAEAQKKADTLIAGRRINLRGMKTVYTMNEAKSESTTAGAAPQADNNGAAGDFSSTNIQVQGVDEADIVKTDGEYIYQVSRDRIIITRAYPADKLELVKTIQYEGRLQPIELYVDERHMIVIGYSNMESYKNMEGIPYYFDGVVTVKIYDISDKSSIEEVREIQLEGQYVSSRKLGSEFYLIANRYIDHHFIRESDKVPDTPLYKDSALGEEFVKVDYNDVKYFPGSIESNYMIAAGLSLDTPKEKLSVDTYMGAGAEVYCSEQNLYAAVSKYNLSDSGRDDPIIYDSVEPAKSLILPRPAYNIDTLVYRFALNRGKLEFVASGTVPGRILNQFSMDEHGDAFRIATTRGETWGRGENISKNNLYVLDMDMKQLGKIEDIAPGETIYSVRFMGDRAYMVTFRTVDPLFVIDLKDKTSPKILGALKIPGYSDYLHPYDENHILGFGKDTVEISQKDANGKVVGTNAFYLGMKVAMFDITDVTKPKELFVEKIGDRGTESPLLNDHKALLFSKDRNLLAFPVTLMETDESTKQGYKDFPAYGVFTFQGAYVYNVDLQNGFRLRSRISHLEDEDYKKAGQYWYDDDRSVQRILYIGNNLYTVSNQLIKVHDLSTLREIKSLDTR